MIAIVIGVLVPVTAFAILALVLWIKSPSRTAGSIIPTTKIPEIIGSTIMIIVLLFMAVVVVSGVIKGVKWCITPEPRPLAIWRDVKVIHLSPDKPTTLPWPDEAPVVGTGFDSHLVPYEDQTKRYQINGTDCGKEEATFKITGGQDVKLTAKQAVDITWQWKY